MTVADMTTMISTVGFPIAMCIAFMWYGYHQQENHKEETEKFTDALNKNTLVLQRLCDKLNCEKVMDHAKDNS